MKLTMPGAFGVGKSARTFCATGLMLLIMLPATGCPVRIVEPARALPAGHVNWDSLAGSNNCPESKLRFAGPPAPQRLTVWPVRKELKSPAFSAAVGTTEVDVWP